MEEKKKFKIDKAKLFNNVVTGSLIVIVSGVILMCLFVVIDPLETKKTNSNVDAQSVDDQTKRIAEALKQIKQSYMGDVDIKTLANGAIEGMAAATGDPYTRYVSQDEYNDMLTSDSSKYSGIGVHIIFDEEKGGILILGVMPNSPALSAGLVAGDVIVQVGDKKVNKSNYEECIDDIKGEEGTQVNLIIKSENSDRSDEKSVTREKIVANNVESKVLDNNIGYIKILAFENGIANQFNEQYNELKSKNIKGLIIDVRNNPGGLVTETTQIANSILPKGEIVKLVNKDGSEKLYNSDGKSEINIPLVTLVNGMSASAAEILAGAIKDSSKGVLVGEKTYGKGIVQTILPLSSDGALSITTAKYYTSSGIEIHKNGIEPNFVVSLPDDVKNDIYIPYDKDVQLQKAIDIINGK